MKIQWKESPNFSSRKGNKIIAIVDHITSGQFPGCRDWLCNTKAQSSAHYVISRAGEIWQLVKDADAAWHAGIVNKPSWALYNGTNPNRYTIGIEHEGYGSSGGDGALTEAQYQATLWLHKQMIAKYGVVVDKDHIIGHYRIDSVNRPNCPGPKFPWERLLNDLQVSTVLQEVLGMFKDVGDSHWAKSSVERLAQLGLIKGDQQGNYNPDAPITRAQIAVVLDRLLQMFGK